MKRIVVMVVVMLATMMVVSAAPVQLDGTCGTAQYDGESIDHWISTAPDKYNCFDIACGLEGNGKPVTIYDPDDPQNRIELRGNASYLTVDPRDLRDIRATCPTPVFHEAFCSVRPLWKFHVGVIRYYDRDEERTEGMTAANDRTRWNNDHGAFIGETSQFDDVPGTQNEVAILDTFEAYICGDKLGPQLLFDESFDLKTGHRTIELNFSDNERQYREMHLSEGVWNKTDPVPILIDYIGGAPDEEIDLTTLNECRFTVTNDDPGDPSTWTEVDCAGKLEQPYQIPDVMLNDPISLEGYTLHMWAEDSAVNDNIASYELTDLYEAYGVDEFGDPEGYCPRENECLMVRDLTTVGPGTGVSLTSNDFTEYLADGNRPACVQPGLGAANVYCSEDGRIERSQALLEYGITELGSENGFVYCGTAERIARSSDPVKGTGKWDASNIYPPNKKPETTMSCVLGIDPASSGEWQQTSALFASNNFLRHGSGDPYIHMPTPFAQDIAVKQPTELQSSSGAYVYKEGSQPCTQSGDITTCPFNTRSPGPLSGDSVDLVYHNLTGLAVMSQRRQPGQPNKDRIAQGHDQLVSDAGLLTDRLNSFLVDLAAPGSVPPEYSEDELKESLRVAAYRQAGQKSILGITARVTDLKVQEGSQFVTLPLYVVGVVYHDFSPGERTFLDEAKDGITNVQQDSTLIRTQIIPGPVSSTEQGETYVLFVIPNGPDEAHEFIEQLVVRPRIES